MSLKTIIEGFTEAQKAEFNIVCKSKIHTVAQKMISAIDKEEAVGAAKDVNGLSALDLESLIVSLDEDTKLSQRPCE